jgi:peptidoglycan/xylan/chitin deacetylase (PgdA/CDA1 family)
MMNLVEWLSESGLVIFLFHGVIKNSNYAVRNYTRKHLEKDYFYRLIKDLQQSGYPLSMDEVVEHHQTGEPFPPRAYAVTFDDGFENNYSIAAPILKDLGIPTTFYIATGYIENITMPWTDRIEYCLEMVDAGKVSFPWSQTIYAFQSPEDKIRILDYLRDHVKRDSSIDTDEMVSSVFLQCGVKEIKQSNDPLDLKMSWQQVRELDQDDSFIVGGHSHRHAILSFLDDTELETDIQTSFDLLLEKASICPQHYAYPEGLAHCYSEQVIKVLANHGIICCPTAIEGINRVSDNLFHLKRVMVV